MAATRRPPAVAKMLERVAATIHDQELWVPGQTVLVAVSGGPDSVCLLEMLTRLRRSQKIRLEVGHVDHALRPDSSADSAYVRKLAARLDVPFRLRILRAATPEGSREAWLRTRRRVALAEMAREAGADRIATAHTRDDNAETVLLRLLSGSGTTGVAGIRHRAGPYVRPLLDVGRDEVEDCCRALHLRPRRDPTNADPSFALRNALRLQGIPALEGALDRNVREPLARAAALLVADDDELMRQALEAWPGVVTDEPHGSALEAAGLLTLPRVVAARLVAEAIHRSGGVASRADIDGVLDLAAGRPGRRRDLTDGMHARRSRTTVQIER